MRSWLLSAVALAACESPAERRDPGEAARIANHALLGYEKERPVPLSSLIDGWQLYEGEGELTGVPREAFARLFAVRGDEEHILYRTTSLAGYVRIRTPEQALEMVRLFSSVETGYLFEDFGEVEIRMAAGEPELGEITEEEYRRLGIAAPTVTRHGSWFVITRCLADEHHQAWRVRELVHEDGSYRLTDRVLVAEVVDIALPGYW